MVASIREQARLHAMEAVLEDILIPTEEVIEQRRGKRVLSKRKFFPGYILVKMVMDEGSRNLIMQTPKVSGFLGAGNEPVPISENEVQRILGQIQGGIEKPRPAIIFNVGEKVRVCDGPFSSFNGYIEYVDVERSRIKVLVSIFGRETPVDLEYTQVEKI